jgi:hypothetical protein
MWDAIFSLLGKGLDLAKGLIGSGKSAGSAVVADTENPSAARAGTAAGAAANHASHVVGPPKSKGA